MQEPEHCTCAQCQTSLVKFGEHVSEKLAYTPAEFDVEPHVAGAPGYTPVPPPIPLVTTVGRSAQADVHQS